MAIIGQDGDTTAVWPFRVYSIEHDDYILSKRFAIMRTIESLNGRVAGPSIIVPNSAVNSDGFTEIGYKPPAGSI